jgi:hypothetical protein
MQKEIKFLELFKTSQRSLVSNILLREIRDGHIEFEDFKNNLKITLLKRLEYNDKDEVAIRLYNFCVSAPDTIKEAFDYYIWWENLSFEERQKIKEENNKVYATLSMRGKNPTPRQIEFLAEKGFTPPGDRLECSKLIDKIIKNNL